MKRALLIFLLLITAAPAIAPVSHAWPYVLDCPCRKYRTLTKRIAEKADEAATYYDMAKGAWNPPRSGEEIRLMLESAVEAQKDMVVIQLQQAKLPFCDKHKHVPPACMKRNHK